MRIEIISSNVLLTMSCSLLFMVGILGSTTIISEYRQFRKAKQRNQNSPMNEKTHLLTSGAAPERELSEDVFEEEPLSLYDCSLETYKETSLPYINCY